MKLVKYLVGNSFLRSIKPFGETSPVHGWDGKEEREDGTSLKILKITLSRSSLLSASSQMVNLFFFWNATMHCNVNATVCYRSHLRVYWLTVKRLFWCDPGEWRYCTVLMWLWQSYQVIEKPMKLKYSNKGVKRSDLSLSESFLFPCCVRIDNNNASSKRPSLLSANNRLTKVFVHISNSTLNSLCFRNWEKKEIEVLLQKYTRARNQNQKIWRIQNLSQFRPKTKHKLFTGFFFGTLP